MRAGTRRAATFRDGLTQLSIDEHRLPAAHARAPGERGARETQLMQLDDLIGAELEMNVPRARGCAGFDARVLRPGDLAVADAGEAGARLRFCGWTRADFGMRIGNAVAVLHATSVG